jgi:hypothetical protein
MVRTLQYEFVQRDQPAVRIPNEDNFAVPVVRRCGQQTTHVDRSFVSPKVGFFDRPRDEEKVLAEQLVDYRWRSANEKFVVERPNDTADPGARDM